MARTAGSVAVLCGLGLGVWMQQAGCEPDGPPLNVAEVGRVLDQVGPGVVIPGLERFRAEAVALNQALAAWEADPLAKPAARAAFVEALQAWQQVDPWRLGPLAPSLDGGGGKDLRDEIYAWPTTNPCLVDQHTIAADPFNAAWFESKLVDAYGLDALEHLLFAGPENACPGQVPINLDGTWVALGDAGVDQARAVHARGIGAQVVVSVDAALADWGVFSWVPDGFDNEQEALNAVFGAVYSVEILVADRKLAEPFFQRDCTVACLDRVELKASRFSHRAVAANLVGIRLLFTGGEGAGLDDLLVNGGQGSTSTSFLEALDQATQTAEAIDRPLDVLYEEDPQAALAFLEQVRRVTDILETDVTTALTLRIPEEAGGDVD